MDPKITPRPSRCFAPRFGELLLCERTSHGELAEAIRQLAARPVRAPGALVARCFSPPTIQRWYYAYRQGGLAALHPKSRSTGNGQALTDSERELLLAVRRDHPRVSAALILRTLETTGKLRPGILSRQTLRRLFRSEGLDRQTLKQHDAQPRRRWEAQAPNALWHTDVCHGPALTAGKRSVPLRVHALLDDHRRYVVAIQACPTERESEMLALTVKALRLHGAPDMIYADNGPTYVGDALSTVCGRLGIGLLHAKPYDPQARGKMERFWRTLREQCLDHVGTLGSHHDVQVRLLAWLDRHYHVTPHSSLMGKTPAESFEAAPRKPIDEALLREALVAHGRRRIRRDGTVQIAGKEFEVEQGFLAGRLVAIGRSLLTPTDPQRCRRHQGNSNRPCCRPRGFPSAKGTRRAAGGGERKALGYRCLGSGRVPHHFVGVRSPPRVLQGAAWAPRRTESKSARPHGVKDSDADRNARPNPRRNVDRRQVAKAEPDAPRGTEAAKH